jgi:hypothetical protein
MKVLLLVLLPLAVLTLKRIDEWQSGVDYTINNNQPKLEQRTNYPLTFSSQIDFRPVFTQTPKVFLTFEHIEFVNFRETEFQAVPSDITITGTKVSQPKASKYDISLEALRF